MREITPEQAESFWREVKREFPDDEMMQEIHFIRLKLHAEREGIQRIFQGPSFPASPDDVFLAGDVRAEDSKVRGMTKIKIYLDTTVPSAYFDDRTPERRKFTVNFWETVMPEYQPLISELVLDEIRKTPDDIKKQQLLDLVTKLDFVPIEETAVALAKTYLQAGISPPLCR